jgi:hypothetical protein
VKFSACGAQTLTDVTHNEIENDERVSARAHCRSSGVVTVITL